MSRLRTRLEALERRHANAAEDWSDIKLVLTEDEWNALTEDERERYQRCPYPPIVISRRIVEGL